MHSAYRLYSLLQSWVILLCRRLRSSDVSTCVVPRTHTGFGDRAFQVAGPRLWNSLPALLRQSDTTVGQFKKLLKTHLFSWDCGALVTVAFTAPCINISTTTTATGRMTDRMTEWLQNERKWKCISNNNNNNTLTMCNLYAAIIMAWSDFCSLYFIYSTFTGHTL